MKTTLAKEFADLRARRGLTLLEVANKCKIAESTVWKIENGRSVRWETVHLCLTLALNAAPKLYNEMQALWVAGRQEMAESHPVDFGSPKQSDHTAAAIRKLRKLLAGLDETTTKRVVAAAMRSARRSE